jgi:hypothetical protein
VLGADLLGEVLGQVPRRPLDLVGRRRGAGHAEALDLGLVAVGRRDARARSVASAARSSSSSVAMNRPSLSSMSDAALFAMVTLTGAPPGGYTLGTRHGPDRGHERRGRQRRAACARQRRRLGHECRDRQRLCASLTMMPGTALG